MILLTALGVDDADDPRRLPAHQRADRPACRSRSSARCGPGGRTWTSTRSGRCWRCARSTWTPRTPRCERVHGTFDRYLRDGLGLGRRGHRGAARQPARSGPAGDDQGLTEGVRRHHPDRRAGRRADPGHVHRDQQVGDRGTARRRGRPASRGRPRCSPSPRARRRRRRSAGPGRPRLSPGHIQTSAATVRTAYPIGAATSGGRRTARRGPAPRERRDVADVRGQEQDHPGDEPTGARHRAARRRRRWRTREPRAPAGPRRRRWRPAGIRRAAASAAAW